MKPSPSLIVIALFSVLFSGCDRPQEKLRKVAVIKPQLKNVTVSQKYFCQIQAQHYIKIRAYEKGYLEPITLKEGERVKEGDLMFKVVPTHLKSKLDGELAEQNYAQMEVDIAKKKFKDKVGSEIELVRAEAKLKSAEAKVQHAEAELGFASVKAPFDGIVGRLNNPHGGMVAKGEILTTLSENSQMRVYFNVPETRYLELMADQNQHHENSPIELVLANGDEYPQTGKFGAIDANFNEKTGSISFRADFPNPDGVLHHGQTGYVLIHRELKDAMVIPQQATFENLEKRFVYLVDKNNVVHQHEIVIQNEVDDLFVVKSGLNLNDTIILDGNRHVHDDEKVEYVDHVAHVPPKP